MKDDLLILEYGEVNVECHKTSIIYVLYYVIVVTYVKQVQYSKNGISLLNVISDIHLC